jgi:TPR repeat protein
MNIAELVQKANDGDRVAQFHLGKMYADGAPFDRDFETAIYWYKKSSDQGYAEADLNWGILLEEDIGISKEVFLEAAQCYWRAGYRGNARGYYKLAVMYENARGVDENHSQARSFYSKAAEMGSPEAQGWLDANPYCQNPQTSRKACDKNSFAIVSRESFFNSSTADQTTTRKEQDEFPGYNSVEHLAYGPLYYERNASQTDTCQDDDDGYFFAPV